MGLQAVGTHKAAAADKAAVTLTVNEIEVALTHAQATDQTAAEIEAALNAAASTSNVQLPEIHAHVNRGGSLALATGKLAHGFTWPEDEELGE